MSSTLHVLFKVGDTEYMLPAERVLHMESFTEATAVPGTPPWVVGLVQSRARVVPVIDLRARFGLPPVERTIDSRVVVVESGDRTVGLLVDSAREVVHVPPDQLRPPPEIVARAGAGFVRAIAQLDGKRMILLADVERIVGEGEERLHGDEQRI